jgi:hypothetical protein
LAIEVPRGPLVEAFLERNFPVFSINPKQLDRFRDRYSSAGAKDDRRDIRYGRISTVSGVWLWITDTVEPSVESPIAYSPC